MQSVIETSIISLPQKSQFGILFFNLILDSAAQLYRKIVSRTAGLIYSIAGSRVIYLG